MSARYDKRKGWLVDFVFQYPDGRKKRIKKKSPVQTRRGSEAYERELRQNLLNPEVEPQKEVPTFAVFFKEFMATYVRSNNKPSEIESKESLYRRYLKTEFGTKPLDGIGVRKIEKYKAKLLDRGLSPKTVKNSLAVLSKVLKYAQEIELIDKVPRIRMPKVPPSEFDFLTFEESDRLLAAAEYQPEWHTMLLVALKTGLRWGELSELRWYDLDLDAGRVLVRRSFTRKQVGTPKGNKHREVPLTPLTVDALKKHQHNLSELVFCKPDGGRRIHRRADVAIKKFCRKANLRPIGWHTLRHTYASHLVMRGVSIKAVQELLGHTDIKMTMRYAHLAPIVKKDAVMVLDGN